MKIYLAGPMRGLPERNYAAFGKAATELRAVGHTVFNPAENFGGDVTRPFAEYVQMDLRALLDQCDTLVVLPGWRESQGATLEVLAAVALDYPVYFYRPVDGRNCLRSVKGWVLVGSAMPFSTGSVHV